MKYLFILFFLLLRFMPSLAQPYTVEKIKKISTIKYDEFSPYFYPGGIIYCSNRFQNNFYHIIDSIGKGMLDIYFIPLSDTSIGQIELFPKPITTKTHDASAWMSPNGKTIYFTRNLYVDDLSLHTFNKKHPNNPLGIFISDNKGYFWSIPRPFTWNDVKYNVMHPTLTSDMKTIIFTSNMSGGYGGYDLYVCYFSLKKGWSKPLNLGPNINTKSDEAFPYLHSSGRLYFARKDSNGLNLYFSAYNDFWTIPQKLFAPLNSEYDDFGLIWNENFTTGFFSSNRDGTDDIYRIKSANPIFIDCKFLKEELYCYKLGSMELKKDISDSTYLEWNFGDGSTDTNVMVNHCYRPGTYIIQLLERYKYNNSIKSIYSNDTLNVKSDIPVLTIPDKCDIGKEIICDASSFADLNNEKYYWWWGDGTIDSTAKVIHKFNESGLYDFRFVLEGLDVKTKENVKTCIYRTIWVNKK